MTVSGIMMQDSDLDAEPESSAADSRPVAPKLAAAAFLPRRSGPVMASDSEYGKPEGLGEYSGHDIRHSLGPGPNLNREPPGRFDQGSIPLDGHGPCSGTTTVTPPAAQRQLRPPPRQVLPHPS